MSQRLSSQELLAQVKGEVKEMSMEELKDRLDQNKHDPYSLKYFHRV